MIECYLNDVNVSTYGLILEDYAVATPSVQTSKVTIPGRNGELDYSTALTGNVAYSNRTVSVRLGVFGKGQDRDTVYYNLMNTFYGKKVKVVFSNLDGYFEGRVITLSRSTNNIHSVITMSIDCYPFRILEDGSEVL